MYSDPSLIRRHATKVRFNDREQDLVRALCAYTGEEPAAFIRSLVLERALEVLHAEQSAAAAGELRGAQAALFAA